MLTEVDINTWTQPISEALCQNLLEDIESGKVIFLPHLKFSLTRDQEKLLSPHCANLKSKNISYNPLTSEVRGCTCRGTDLKNLQEMMDRFAKSAHALVKTLFPHYCTALQWGRTSYRPVDVEGRKIASYRKDDTRLHVDSFAATPVQGLRLLRVFSNINPHHPRVWKLGEPFEEVAQRFLAKLSQKQWLSPRILQMLGITKGIRTPYDHLMLQLHDHMKKDLTYQKEATQVEIAFPNGSTWVALTDQVSHAALSGQFLLEQTFYLPPTAMQSPERAPLSVLERLTGRALVEEVRKPPIWGLE